MNRDRLKKYKSETEAEKKFRENKDKTSKKLNGWQKNVIKLLSNSKKNLENSIGKSDIKEQRLCLLSYLKLCSIYKLADFLSKKIYEYNNSESVKYKEDNLEKLYVELKEFERIVFNFIDIFNARIDDCLDSNDEKAFDWMCMNINGLEGRIVSSEIESIKKLLGKIKDVEVIPGYSYNKIVDFIRNGMKDDAVYDTAIKCIDPKNISIIF